MQWVHDRTPVISDDGDCDGDVFSTKQATHAGPGGQGPVFAPETG
jgi:hypothetical protein